MSLVVISVDRSKFPTHTDEDFADWIGFQVGHNRLLDLDNPLFHIDLDARVKEIG